MKVEVNIRICYYVGWENPPFSAEIGGCGRLHKFDESAVESTPSKQNVNHSLVLVKDASSTTKSRSER